MIYEKTWRLVYGEIFSMISWPDKTTPFFLSVINESRITI